MTSTWLPISDAPHDQTEILIAKRWRDNSYTFAVGRWDDEMECFTFDGGDKVGGNEGDMFQYIVAPNGKPFIRQHNKIGWMIDET